MSFLKMILVWSCLLFHQESTSNPCLSPSQENLIDTDFAILALTTFAPGGHSPWWLRSSMPIDGNKDKFVVNLEFDENNSIKIKRSMGFPFPRNNSILSHHHRFWNGFVYYVGFQIAAAPSFSVLINSKIVNKFNSSETWRHKNLILKWRCWGCCNYSLGWVKIFHKNH